MRGRAGTSATLLAALLAAACGSGAPPPQVELVVAAAVSLREPVSEIARSFEEERPDARLRLGFGATSQLAAQLRAGAPIDVLLSADERSVEQLVDEGRVARSAPFVLARNRLVVMQRSDAAPPIEGPDDLADPAVRRIAIPEHAVPVGHYARDWLERRGLLAALSGRIVPTEHARATLAAVDEGLVDAAIVYATDARLARRARLASEIAASDQPPIVYVATRVADARHGELADGFLAFLRQARAQQVLVRAGFGSGT